MSDQATINLPSLTFTLSEGSAMHNAVAEIMTGVREATAKDLMDRLAKGLSPSAYAEVLKVLS